MAASVINVLMLGSSSKLGPNEGYVQRFSSVALPVKGMIEHDPIFFPKKIFTALRGRVRPVRIFFPDNACFYGQQTRVFRTGSQLPNVSLTPRLE